MPSFGRKSRAILSTLCEDAQDVLIVAVKFIDFSLIDGARKEARQTQAFTSNPPLSKARFGQSAHNWNCSCCSSKSLPRAMAFDIVPYPVPPWNSRNPSAIAETERRFNEVLLVLSVAAEALGVGITLGKNFSLKDFPHIEITDWALRKKNLITSDWTDIFQPGNNF
ncbi:MAG: hypothetical protein OQK82_02805 [Candidatus Pacearchaeota archaeon]|nr:hypothetical protein [Candidatus Pacearchaeota archaeon]